MGVRGRGGCGGGGGVWGWEGGWGGGGGGVGGTHTRWASSEHFSGRQESSQGRSRPELAAQVIARWVCTPAERSFCLVLEPSEPAPYVLARLSVARCLLRYLRYG